MKSSGRSFFEAARLIDSKSNNKNIVDSLTEALEKSPEFLEYDLQVINKLHLNVFRNKRAQEYFTSRNITKDSVIKYTLGYSENQDMVTVPVHSPDGFCIGFVGRSIEGKSFKNTPGLQKSKTLFNLHRAKRFDKVFIVESSFDAIRIEQIGGHAVATLGATISNEQRKLLKQYFNQIIVLGDNDEAGRSMTQKLKDTFGPGCVAPQLPEGIKDVSDLSDDLLKEFIDTFDDLILSMLK
jgi:DNA primase